MNIEPRDFLNDAVDKVNVGCASDSKVGKQKALYLVEP